MLYQLLPWDVLVTSCGEVGEWSEKTRAQHSQGSGAGVTFREGLCGGGQAWGARAAETGGGDRVCLCVHLPR